MERPKVGSWCVNRHARGTTIKAAAQRMRLRRSFHSRPARAVPKGWEVRGIEGRRRGGPGGTHVTQQPYTLSEATPHNQTARALAHQGAQPHCSTAHAACRGGDAHTRHHVPHHSSRTPLAPHPLEPGTRCSSSRIPQASTPARLQHAYTAAPWRMLSRRRAVGSHTPHAPQGASHGRHAAGSTHTHQVAPWAHGRHCPSCTLEARQLGGVSRHAGARRHHPAPLLRGSASARRHPRRQRTWHAVPRRRHPTGRPLQRASRTRHASHHAHAPRPRTRSRPGPGSRSGPGAHAMSTWKVHWHCPPGRPRLQALEAPWGPRLWQVPWRAPQRKAPWRWRPPAPTRLLAVLGSFRH